jgi:hypothetical protein
LIARYLGLSTNRLIQYAQRQRRMDRRVLPPYL